MRVLVDTNVLFSALLFPSSKPALAVAHVVEHHECPPGMAAIRETEEIIANGGDGRRLETVEDVIAALDPSPRHARAQTDWNRRPG